LKLAWSFGVAAIPVRRQTLETGVDKVEATIVVVVQTMDTLEERAATPTTSSATHAKAAMEEEAVIVVVTVAQATTHDLAAKCATKSVTLLSDVGTDLRKTTCLRRSTSLLPLEAPTTSTRTGTLTQALQITSLGAREASGP
jgi:hypothetical protein